MIARYDMIAAFTRLDPGVASLWKELNQQWSDDPDEAERRFISNLAHHLIIKLAARETKSFRAFFEVIDDCLLRGDVLVRHLMRSVLLADLQNTGLHLTTSPRHFELWLSPSMLPSWANTARSESVKGRLSSLDIDAEILAGPGISPYSRGSGSAKLGAARPGLAQHGAGPQVHFDRLGQIEADHNS